MQTETHRPPSWGSTHFSRAIVIGSGFGGSVAALRLGQNGIQTLVLERGRRWPITPDGNTFATFEKPDGRAAWLSETSPVALEQLVGMTPARLDVFAGVLEGIAGNGINVVAGAGVGGGSLIHNGITVQPRREMFDRVFAGQLDFDEFAQIYYPLARSQLRAAPVPEDILASDLFRSSRVSLEAARRAGFETRPVDLTIDWSVVREEISGARVASAIAGQSWYGLNSGAKQSLDKTYLLEAERTGKVEVLPLHVVTSITQIVRSGLYVVTAQQISDVGAVLGERSFVCEYLFIAAGSAGTSRLLVTATATGALPRLDAQVGRGWGTNGDVVFVHAGAEARNPGTGGPAGHFIAEDFSDPTHPVSFVELVTPRNLALSPGIASHIGMGIAPAIGSWTYAADRAEAVLNWPIDSRQLSAFNASTGETFARLNAAAVTQTVISAANITSHPLGGCNIGTACDSFGRVKNYRGLYVVDGSAIPGTSGLVNPSLTIAAVAERSLQHLLDTEIG